MSQWSQDSWKNLRPADLNRDPASFLCWCFYFTMKLDKHKVTIVHRHALRGMLSASPTPPIVSLGVQHNLWCKVPNMKPRQICLLPSHCAGGGHRKYVANLAELGADSSGKLCAEVDKDINGCTCADSTERPQHFTILNIYCLELFQAEVKEGWGSREQDWGK